MNPTPKDTKQLTIALVTDDRYRVDCLREMAAEPGWALIEKPHPQPAQDWLRTQPCDLVVVDLDVADATTLLATLRQQMPHIPLLALATPQRLAELQDALLSGAAAFISFPTDAAQFVATVVRTVQESLQSNAQHRIHGMAPPPEPAVQPEPRRIIAVTGLKGGVGRSTLAANLALALQMREQGGVILVEAHHGLSDLCAMLNLHPVRTLANLAEEAHVDLDIVRGNLCQHDSGLRVLTAPKTLTHLVEMPAEAWRHILSLLTELAPLIVVDTAAVADALLSEVLTQADDILAVTGPDVASLNGVHALLQTLRAEDTVHGRTHLVLNRAGLQGGVNPAAICKRLEHPLVSELPEDAPLATYSLNRGIPCVVSHPRALLSRRYVQLADYLQEASTGATRTAQNGHRPGPIESLRNRAAAFASLF